MDAAIRVLRSVGFIEGSGHCHQCLEYGPEYSNGETAQILYHESPNYCFKANPHPITRRDYQSDREFEAALKQLDRRLGYPQIIIRYPHIGLHLRSCNLWPFPFPLTMDLPTENRDGPFTLASDIALPSVRPFHEWRYSASYGPVVVMTPKLFLLSLVRKLLCCVHLEGRIRFDESLWVRLMRIPDCVAPEFKDTVYDILKWERFDEPGLRDIRGIWMLVNSVDPSDDISFSRQFGRELSDEDEHAFLARFKQVAEKLGPVLGWDDIPSHWRFRPSQ